MLESSRIGGSQEFVVVIRADVSAQLIDSTRRMQRSLRCGGPVRVGVMCFLFHFGEQVHDQNVQDEGGYRALFLRC